MKKQVFAILSIATLSTGVYASKARMEALNQGSYSPYISDSRSVFGNPASINANKNFLLIEWGRTGSVDSATAPRAEGGFFREMGAFAYGVYLNNADSRIQHVNAKVVQHNPLDFFFGGDQGVRWGARVHYANYKDEINNEKNNALGLGLGIEYGEIEGYANVDFADKSTTATAESKLKPSFTVGASTKLASWTAFADYSSAKQEEGTDTYKKQDIRVGFGRVHEVNPTSRIFSDLSVVLTTDENTVAGKTTYNHLPLTLGMEADALPWLTLRGSIKQDFVYGVEKDNAGKTKTIDSTSVNAGATLNFGKLKVDNSIATIPNTNRNTFRTSLGYWF